MIKKLIAIISIITFLVLIVFYTNNKNEKLKLNVIRNKYSKYVITNSISNLYDKKGKIVGKVGNSVKLELKNIDVSSINSEYFELELFPSTFIKYNTIDKVDALDNIDTTYQKYVVFNENIKTKNRTCFYDSNYNLLYEINKLYNLPIIIKEDNYYGVFLNNSLVYVKKSDVEVVENNNTVENVSESIPILLYHFFHTHNRYENMNNVISIKTDKFSEQLKYLSDNNFTTLKMKDLEYFVDGKVRLKDNSVLITIDDANDTIFTLAKPIIEKYNINVTVFAITSYNENIINMSTNNIEIHSHSHNMHITNKCSGGQGGIFKCIDKKSGLEDLKLSSKLLNNTHYFAYPFGEYTNNSIELLKESGYTLALTTNYGKAKVGDNKLLLPRIYIYNEYSIDTFKKIVK